MKSIKYGYDRSKALWGIVALEDNSPLQFWFAFDPKQTSLLVTTAKSKYNISKVTKVKSIDIQALLF